MACKGSGLMSWWASAVQAVSRLSTMLICSVLSFQVILDLKGSDYSWSYQTPPSSPSTTMSRKSSVCR